MASPLADLTKDEVREASRELGLPNWNFAASPCLRSRLALNVEVSQPVGVHFALVLDSAGGCDQATERHLAAVETAEEIVRRELSLTPEDNLRVRMVRRCPSPSQHPAPLTPRRLQLAGRRVAIEVDNRLVDQAT